MATYSINSPQSQQRRAQGAPQGGRGVSSSGVQAPISPLNPTRQIDTRTTEALFQLAGKALEPMVQKKQAEKYLEGMQAVQQGQAYKEIVDQQPWYSTIFGPTASQRGAQQMTLIKQQDEFANGIYGDMDTLRKLDPQAFGEEVRARQTSNLTGDAGTDVLLMQKMVETSGQFYNTHAKAHYKYVQEENYKARVGMMNAAADSVAGQTSRMWQGEIDRADLDASIGQALMGATRMEGESDESYFNGLLDTSLMQMQKGNHHYIRGIVQSGVVDTMPPELQVKFHTSRIASEKATLDKAGMLDFGLETAALYEQATSPEEFARGAIALNERAREKYGVETDMISKDQFVRGVRSAGKGSKTADEKADAEAAMRGAVYGGVGRISGVSQKAHQEMLHNSVINELEDGNTATAMKLLTTNAIGGLVDPVLQAQYQAPLRAGSGPNQATKHLGDATRQSVAVYRAMMSNGGEGAAVLYFGQYAPQMSRFVRNLDDGLDEQSAWDLAFGKDATRLSTPVSRSEVTAATEAAVDNALPGLWAKVTTGQPEPDEDSKKAVARYMQPLVQDAMNNLGMDESQAANYAKDRFYAGHEIVGPAVISRPVGDPALANLVQMGGPEANKALIEEVMRQGKAQGLRVGRLTPQTLTSGYGETIKGLAPDGLRRLFSSDVDFTVTSATQQTFDKGGEHPYAKVYLDVTDQDGKRRSIIIDTRDVNPYFKEQGFDSLNPKM